MSELARPSGARASVAAIAAGFTSAFLLVGAAQVYGVTVWLLCLPFASRRWCPRNLAQWMIAGASFGLAVALMVHASWLIEVLMRYFGLSRAASALLTLGLAGMWAMLEGAILGALMAPAARIPGIRGVFAVAAAWSVWEILIAWMPPSYPWVSLAATQPPHAPWLRLVRVGGSPALAFVIIAVSCGLARWLTLPPLRRRLSVALGCLGAVLAGAAMMPIDDGPPGHCVVTAIDAQVMRASDRDAGLQRYRQLSTPAFAAAHPDVLIWPESALPGFANLDNDLQNRLRDSVASWNVPLVAGGGRVGWEKGWRERHYNSVYFVRPRAEIETYDKRTLVLGAEYWPFAFPPRPTWLAVDETTPGDRAAVFRHGDCQLGPLICFEANQSGLAYELARLGARALVVVSNDAQLAQRTVDFEVAQVRLRALETGLPVVRAANAGRSIIVDPYGRTVASSSAGVMTGALPSAQPAPALNLAWPFSILVVAINGWSWWTCLKKRG